MKRLEKLIGYQDYKANNGIRYADDVIPDGVRKRLAEHKADLFEDQHNHACALEFCLRALRYGVEVVIYFGRLDSRQKRRLINQLKENTEVMQTLIYRSWLSLCGHQKYATAEREQMQKVNKFILSVYDKINEIEKFVFNELDKSYEEFLSNNGLEDDCDHNGIDELAESNPNERFARLEAEWKYIDDVFEVVDMAYEWIGIESLSYTGIEKEPTWEDLQLRPEVIAALDGREVETSTEVAAPTADGKTVFNTKQAAEYLGVRPNYMNQMRSMGTGPTFMRVKTGRGNFDETVLYHVDDIISWIKSRPLTASQVRNRKAPAAAHLDLTV